MASSTEGGKTEQSRYDLFNVACDKSIALIDVTATTKNFQTAFPTAKPETIEEAGKAFVTQLKQSIKREKDTLAAKYGVEEKLNDLDQLVHEAEERSGSKENFKDVWRPDIDTSTAIYSRSSPLYQQRIASLEQELQGIESENSRLAMQLEGTVRESEGLRLDANDSLQRLEQTIHGLETTPEVLLEMRETISKLLEELGPRGTSFKPP